MNPLMLFSDTCRNEVAGRELESTSVTQTRSELGELGVTLSVARAKAIPGVNISLTKTGLKLLVVVMDMDVLMDILTGDPSAQGLVHLCLMIIQ